MKVHHAVLHVANLLFCLAKKLVKWGKSDGEGRTDREGNRERNPYQTIPGEMKFQCKAIVLIIIIHMTWQSKTGLQTVMHNLHSHILFLD